MPELRSVTWGLGGGLKKSETNSVKYFMDSPPHGSALFPRSAFNDDMVPLLDKINFANLTTSDFRALISRKVGLPVGAFRLLNETFTEMFDCHTLYDYGVTIGSTVRLDTWDGWNDFLNLTVMGFSSQVMASLMSDDAVAKYQMKVAMYMAAHFGHVDLAVSLLRCKFVIFQFTAVSYSPSCSFLPITLSFHPP